MQSAGPRFESNDGMRLSKLNVAAIKSSRFRGGISATSHTSEVPQPRTISRLLSGLNASVCTEFREPPTSKSASNWPVAAFHNLTSAGPGESAEGPDTSPSPTGDHPG